MSEPTIQPNMAKNVAQVLRSTETMAVRFVERVQERVDEPVSPQEILKAMKKISSKRLTMDRVIAKIERMKK